MSSDQLKRANERLAHAEELIRLGLFSQAESVCRDLVQIAPQEARAWFALGIIGFHEKRFRDAEQAFKQVLLLEPGNADAWGNLSTTVREEGRPTEAEGLARQGLVLQPRNASHWLILGNALSSQGRWKDALEAFQQSVACNANEEAAWCNIGLAKEELGELAAAQAAYEHALSLAPDTAPVKVNLARVQCKRGDPQRAIDVLKNTVKSALNIGSAWIVLGNAYRLLSEFDKAEAAYRHALDDTSWRADALHQLGLVLLAKGKSRDAEAIIRLAIGEGPSAAHTYSLLGECLRAQGRIEEAVTEFRRSLMLDPNADRHSKLLLTLQCLDNVRPKQLLNEHRAWAVAYAANLPTLKRKSDLFPGDRPLRIGFVSADFAQHPVAFVALPLLEHIDRERCTITCYSDRLVEDAYTSRVRQKADNWRATFGLSDQELCEQIHKDEIDILVDLAGHAGKRLLVFAQKPARIQFTWFGYVGTTGLTAMDYLLADRFHVLPDEEQYYTEAILRMPNGYACYGPPPGTSEVVALPALAGGRITFGCFNNPAKFAPRIVGEWTEILRRVSGSLLLLKYGGLDDASLQARIKQMFAERGIGAERLLFEGWSPLNEHFATYNRIDIALDTQPYSGGVTTCEALWMGVPVITFPGRTFAGRHATSHLMNAGYPQFVAEDEVGYVELAEEWANRLDELALIRTQMRNQVRHSSLCDAPRFAYDFLSVLRQAWESRCGTGISLP
jgi:protein O-GlcNAc transferase